MDRVGEPGQVTLTQDDEHTYTVIDSGRGFSDTPEELGYRFSIAKVMVPSKQWRRPTRGCVGNGLRVIVASVATGRGRIIVKTRNQAVTLRPRLDGSTAIEEVTPIEWPIGSAITIQIDRNYRAHGETLAWAQLAISLAQNSGAAFNRKPHPLWFDADHLALNMLAAIGADRTLAWFVSQLDRCSSREVGQQVTAKFGKGRLGRDVSKEEAAELLRLLQYLAAAPIKPKQLGPMGRAAWKHEQLTDGYTCEEGSFETGRHEPHGAIPFLVEAWAATCATPAETNDDDVYQVDIIGLTINRSPAIISFHSSREGRSRALMLTLGDMYLDLDVPKGAFDFAINITTPAIEILGDNKTPFLGKFHRAIQEAVQSAICRAARNNPPELVAKGGGEKNSDHQNSSPKKASQREQVLAILLKGDAVAKASGNGSLSFNQRSLYYVVREEVPGLEDGYFGQLVTEYENEHSETTRMFRNNRGAFYEPHGYGVTPLGTLTVRAYRRGPWIYGTVLVCEKEDNVHMLRESGFAERWDCFLLSSSGFTTRALKDLIDYIGETARTEPVRIFAMIDADAHGSVIFQTLVQETKARGARNIEITNLGLFPWEGLSDGLQHESGLIAQARKKDKYRRSKVADYILERDQQNRRSGNPDNEPNWQEWLQDNRIELNAMTSPQRVVWVERKFERAGVKKVIPPEEIALADLSKKVRDEISAQVEAEALRDKHAWIAEQTKRRFDSITLPTDLAKRIGEYLKSHRTNRWTDAINTLANSLTANS